METSDAYFAVRPARYVSKAMPRWLMRRGWPLWVPLALMAAGGLYDSRWLLAAMMLLAALLPAAVAMVYLHSALSPRAAMQTLPHSVSINAGAIVLTFLPAEEGRTPPAPLSVPASDIRAIEPDGDTWLVWTRSEPLVPVLVPAGYIKNHVGEASWHTFCSLICYDE